MASKSIRVRVGGKLKARVEQQIGEGRLYENASEYIRSLIRRDLGVPRMSSTQRAMSKFGLAPTK